jgi:chromosome segregation ATPase
MKAMEILSSRVKVFLHREGLLQVEHKQPAQEAGQMQEAKVRQTLMNHFRNLGTKLHSLSMLNMVSAASVQPMDKVKGLIKELIEKLQREAADAASTHAWCEEENKKNTVAKEKASDKLKTLEIRLEKANAKKAELSDNIQALTEAIAEIDASDAEATKIRNEEHANFQKAEADFKEAASAVLDAIDALKDYYGDTVFLQTESGIETTTTSPIRFQAPDLGGAKKDSAGGVLSILDMMATEFAKTVSELQSNEREKKKAYDKMTNDNEVSKASKQSEIKGATSEIASLTVAAGHAADDKAMTQDEMNALLAYIEKLKPTCVGTVMSYAERKAKREAEIEGLKQAMNLLEETQGTLSTVSFLQVRPHKNEIL